MKAKRVKKPQSQIVEINGIKYYSVPSDTKGAQNIKTTNGDMWIIPYKIDTL